MIMRCPSCSRRCACDLDANVHVVFLRCPSCHTPLLHYYGETFPIEERELRTLERHGQVQASSLALRILSESGARHDIGEPVADHPINSDDIANLRIELGRTADVNDFLDRL